MSERSYNILVVILFFAVLWAFMKPTKPQKNYNVNINATATAADGLDLEALGALVKKAKDAEHLEKMLNDKDNGINNLDLDEDDKVDYIQVTEFGNDKSKGFSLTVEPSKGEEQEVATISIEKTDNERANVEVRGNRNIYGGNAYYHSHYPVTSLLLWSYLWRPHPFYMSPWHYGYYPGFYRPYPIVSRSVYHTRTRTITKSSPMQKSGQSNMRSPAKSPNSGKSASSVKAPLKSPTKSQKSFQARNPSKRVKSGGFGRNRKSSSSNSKASVRRSSTRRSGGFSRGGK